MLDLALAGKSAIPLLSGVVRPSGYPSAEIAYDSTTGSVAQVTDSNGGLWKISGSVYSGSSQVYAGAVLSGGPADYWRFAETGAADAVDQVHGGIARYNGVTLGTPNGPFADSTVAGFNGTSSSVSLPAAVSSHTGDADMRDLTVADVHTYYVMAGTTPVLVHNCGEPWMGENTYAKIDRDHGPNSSVSGKSKFDEGVDYDDLADHSANFPDRAQTTGTRCERICTSPNGKPIGVDQNGLPTNVYTVVTEANGRIVTMHPGIPN